MKQGGYSSYGHKLTAEPNPTKTRGNERKLEKRHETTERLAPKAKTTKSKKPFSTKTQHDSKRAGPAEKQNKRKTEQQLDSQQDQNRGHNRTAETAAKQQQNSTTAEQQDGRTEEGIGVQTSRNRVRRYHD